MLKKLIATIVVLSVLSVGTLTPKGAHALGTAELVFISIGAYAAAVLTGAYFVFRERSSPPPEELLTAAPGASVSGDHPGAIRFGPRCRPDSGNLALVCW